MNISAILAKAQKSDDFELTANKDKSIGLVREDVFYVEPIFTDIAYNQTSNVLIFSAPGATGKSTLSKRIAADFNVLYWDLSKIKLGDNSFLGTLYKSLNNVQEYFDLLKDGKTFIVIDAFDEAVIISGKNSVIDFLKDILEVCKECKGADCFSFVLMARTETAKELVNICKNEDINFSHFEIGLISEENAKSFIYNKIGKKRNSNVDNCINEQFALIGRLLGDDKAKKSFLGYPPVLEALSGAYDDENNIIKFLNKLNNGGSFEGSKLIYSILNNLIDREHNKVVDALKNNWSSKYPKFDEWDKLYSSHEQIIRIVEYIYLGSKDLFSVNYLAEDIKRDYLEVVDSFLPQHPFLRNAFVDSIDFAGPAFRDYVFAKLINDPEYGELFRDYFSGSSVKTNVPSQLFFDFFIKEPNAKLHGKDFPFLYDAFKAKERMNYEGTCRISGDDEGVSSTFELLDEEVSISEEIVEMYGNEPILVTKLANSSIIANEIICLGKENVSAEIVDSSIDCRELMINCKELFIKSTRVGGVCIVSKNDVVTSNAIHPKIIVEADTDDYIRVDVPNANKYYQFSIYKYKNLEVGDERLLRFSAVVDKILDCMRKHKKDAPAKDIDYIDNEIIAGNEFKRNVLSNLRRLGIIYTDSKDKHLYKLNTNKMKEYGIGWQALNRFGVEKFKKLYSLCEWK